MADVGFGVASAMDFRSGSGSETSATVAGRRTVAGGGAPFAGGVKLDAMGSVGTLGLDMFAVASVAGATLGVET